MRLLLLAFLIPALAVGVASAQPKEKDLGPAVEIGSRVQIEYTLKDEAGDVLDSNKGEAPLVYTHGRREIVPGLERALTGMHTGDEKHVRVAPEDGYGPVDPSAQTEVPKEMIPADALTVGTELVAQSPRGQIRLVRVKEVRATTVVIDLNHPLAGKTLLFDVKVLNVEAPQK